MKKSFALLVALMLTALLSLSALAENQTIDILDKIELMATSDETIDPALGQSVVEMIEENPQPVAVALLSKLGSDSTSDNQLAVYVWALGLAKSQTAVKPIQDVYRQSSSDLVKSNCLYALAVIGGKPAEDFLLAELQGSEDGEARFDLMNLLGQMQCEAVLPFTEEILEKDPNQYYWQSILVFGKMGDPATSFLIEHINSENRNVRANAINVLGHWLIAPEATSHLLERYWVEDDRELRGIILSSLEKNILDLSRMKSVFEEITEKEKDEQLLIFAHETLDNMATMKAAVADFAGKKITSADAFLSAYTVLLDSEGEEGSYEAMGIYSTENDEPRLKALRKKILLRDSDEAFYDYQKINNIIMLNRLAGI